MSQTSERTGPEEGPGDGPGDGPAEGAAAPKHRHYSKNYWDLVFEQLAHRSLFKVGMVILTVLYGMAVFAPLIANDKAYVIESVDLSRYTSTVRMLSPTATSAQRYAKMTDEEYEASIEGKDQAAPQRGAAFAIEWNAAQDRLALIRPYLRAQDHAPLDEYEGDFRAAAEAFGVTPEFELAMRRSGVLEASDDRSALVYPEWNAPADTQATIASLDSVKKLARKFRRSLAPWNPAKPDKEGLQLLGQRTTPLKVSLRPWEIGLMVFWVLFALWPIWNPLLNTLLLFRNRERIRKARFWKTVAVLGLSIGAAVGWRITVGPGTQGLDIAPHKKALTDGSMFLVAEGQTLREAIEGEGAGEVVWAPVNYGYAETHAVERYRRPTWHSDAEIEPETGYLTAEHLKPSMDPVTKELPPPIPLDMRVGEPEANAWDRHLAGTDELGRDFFGRMVWGSRVSLSVGIVSAVLLTVIGVVMGALAGFFGGRVDTLIMRMIEILQSIPAFFLILMAMAFTDPKVVPPMMAIVVVIALVRWTGVARLVRGEFLRLREQDFVVAAQALGFSSARIIFRHVLPNAMSPVLVACAFSVASGILTESAISFLGFGVKPPDASWGSLVNASKSAEHWWIQIFPGLLIFVTVTCYNLVGDAVRDALDPKMKV